MSIKNGVENCKYTVLIFCHLWGYGLSLGESLRYEANTECGAAGGTFICRNRPVEQRGGIHRRSAEEICAFPIKLTLQKTVLIRENKGVQHEFDL